MNRRRRRTLLLGLCLLCAAAPPARASGQTLFAGAAAAFDHDGLSWSPEVGIKFLHRDMGKDPLVDLSLHLLVRATSPRG